MALWLGIELLPGRAISHSPTPRYPRQPIVIPRFSVVNCVGGIAVAQQRVQHFLWQQSGIYYFVRRVPKYIQGYYKSSRVVICLKAKRRDNALKASRSIAQRLENYWLTLRLSKLDIPASHLLRDKPLFPPTSSSMTLSGALELYLRLKGSNKGKGFHRGAERSIESVIDVLGDRLVDDEARWLVSLISDTGMRLSEAAGLHINNIILDEDISYINLTPHPWRSLKTNGRQRQIPLVGAS